MEGVLCLIGTAEAERIAGEDSTPVCSLGKPADAQVQAQAQSTQVYLCLPFAVVAPGAGNVEVL